MDAIGPSARWLWANPDDEASGNPPTYTPKDDAGIPAGGQGRGPGRSVVECACHGTQMLDMISGARGGTSRRVQPIVSEHFLLFSVLQSVCGARGPYRALVRHGSNTHDLFFTVDLILCSFNFKAA